VIDDLINHPCTIVRRSQAEDADDFSGPTEDDPPTVETVCALQQRARTEPDGQGELSDTDWLLILKADEAIDTTDAVEIDGREFEVVGDPWPVVDHEFDTVSHLEVSLKRTGNA